MNRFKLLALLFGAVCSMLAAGTASAYRGHYRGARVGVFIGAPLFPYYAAPYYPRYYYPPTVVVPAPAAAPVYIEQTPAAAAPAAPAQSSGAYWYYCRDTQTYYPYVQQCASPWEQVVPQSTPSS